MEQITWVFSSIVYAGSSVQFFWMFGLISGKGQCCEIFFLELEQPEREVAKAHCFLQYLTVINCKTVFFHSKDDRSQDPEKGML